MYRKLYLKVNAVLTYINRHKRDDEAFHKISDINETGIYYFVMSYLYKQRFL